MKNTVKIHRGFLLISVLFFGLGTNTKVLSQSSSEVIGALMNQCDIPAVISKFASDVELCVFETKEYLGAKSVSSAFNTFLKNNPCQKFVVKHHGSDKKNLNKEFMIGTLVTTNGEFRLTFFIRNNQILELDINYPKI